MAWTLYDLEVLGIHPFRFSRQVEPEVTRLSRCVAVLAFDDPKPLPL